MKRRSSFLYLIVQVILLVVLSVSTHAKTGEPGELFEKANQQYLKNDLGSAIKLYEELVKGDHENAEIYYNLGNAYYKQGNVAAAILNYERAKKLNPNDDDIVFNLKMANLKVTDKMEQVPPLFYEQWWNKIIHSFITDQWAMIGIVLLWMVLVVSVLFLLSKYSAVKRTTFYIGFFLLLFASVSFFFASSRYQESQSSDEGIVFSPSVYIKSSPTEKSTDLFILHEGTKVQLLDKVGEWKKIRLANGNIGWLKENAIQVI